MADLTHGGDSGAVNVQPLPVEQPAMPRDEQAGAALRKLTDLDGPTVIREANDISIGHCPAEVAIAPQVDLDPALPARS